MNVTEKKNNGLFGKLKYFRSKLEENSNRKNKMNKLFQPTF